nr:tripartite tricarboxylate transporter TctB family protein [uncultured Roseateles sp.]
MNNRNLVRGLFLAAIALSFGLGALQYPLGSFARAGAGMFPFMMSSLLFVIAIITIVRSRFVAPEPLGFNLKNIALILAALCSCALLTKLLNMSVGIAAMVFIAAFAGTSYSWQRNLKVAAGLIAVAFAFQKLLGLNLPLL